jgi:hypothetical protein
MLCSQPQPCLDVEILVLRSLFADLLLLSIRCTVRASDLGTFLSSPLSVHFRIISGTRSFDILHSWLVLIYQTRQ